MYWAGCTITYDLLLDSVLSRDNLASWKSQEQNLVARSRANAKYCPMVLTTCQPIIWMKRSSELPFCDVALVYLIHDNYAALLLLLIQFFIAEQSILRLNVLLFVRRLIPGASLVLSTPMIIQQTSLMNLCEPRISYICSTLDAYDTNALA